MDRLSSYAKRPIAFLLRYVRRRALSHAAILAAVIGAVACSVSSQYGVKFLVDVLSGSVDNSAIWLAFALLVSAIRRGSTLATAMEARGFGAHPTRTWARPSPFGRREVALICAAFVIVAVAIATSVATGHWNLIATR